MATFNSGGTPSKSNAAFWKGEIPWVSAKDMKTDRLSDTQDHISRDGLEQGSRLAAAGSSLLLTRGMTLLTDVPICLLDREMAFNQDVKAIAPQEGIDAHFLNFALRAAKPELLTMVDLAGHGTGRLPTDRLKALRLPLPALSEQRAIAIILRSLDDKIERNFCMNETLEAMARTMFESWFAADSGNGRSSWTENRIDSIASLSRDSLDPRAYPGDQFDHYSLPAFDERRLPALDRGATIKSNKLVVPPNSILLSKLNPRIPRVWLPTVAKASQSICSTEFLVVIPREHVPREWLYGLLTSAAFLDRFATFVTGTSGSHQRVQPESLLAMKVRVPPTTTMERFAAVAKPIFSQIARNLAESQVIVATRDALLPRLLSGEIRVKEI